MPSRRAKPWSEVEDRQLIELSHEGQKTAEIAKAMSRSEEGVRQRLQGIALRQKVRLIHRKYPDASRSS